jgi:alkylhydroperoxidase family enzyme
LARRLGATEAVIASVRSDGAVDAALFEPAWVPAFAYADAMDGTGHVSDALFEALAAHWDEGQIVEITMVVGLFAYFNRFNNALCVEVTR